MLRFRRLCALALAVAVSSANTVAAGDPQASALRAAPDDAARLVEMARLVERRPRGAAAEIEALLQEGHADAVTDAALAALGEIAAPESRAILEAFTSHRRVAARMLAYEALAKLPARELDGVVARALRDSAPEVRALGTRLLSARRARATVDALLLALDRGVPEAAVAVGQLADDRSALLLAERLNKAPFDAMLAGCRALLCRSDLQPVTKQRVVVALEETSGNAVHSLLASLSAGPTCTLDARTKTSIAEAVKRTKPRPADKTVAP